MVSRRIKLFWWFSNNFFRWILPVFVLAGSLLGLLVYLQRPQAESPFLVSHILIFGIVNLNLIILFVLIFLVGRNFIKLIFDRKRNILGSHLRARLVLVFVSLAMVPSIIVCILATGLLTQAMQGWFSGHVEGASQGALAVARSYYNVQKREAKKLASELSSFTSANLSNLDSNQSQSALESIRERHELFAIAIYNPDGGLVVSAQHATAGLDGFQLPVINVSGLEKAVAGTVVVLFEREGQSLYVRSYAPTVYEGDKHILLTTVRIDSNVSEALHLVNDSYKEYAQLKLFRTPLQTGYVLTLVMITGLILFAAIWVGFFIAREITGPIQKLAEATNSVARGNYDVQLTARGKDEIAFLIRSFNKMTSDLKRSTADAEEHRSYLETILTNLAVGVIGIDTDGTVTTVNTAASDMLGISTDITKQKPSIDSVLEPELLKQISLLLDRTLNDQSLVRDDLFEQELKIDVQGIQKRFICTAGRLTSSSGDFQGGVLLFDDITDLSRAQEQAAWREVARRLAHEIKNPLTPLKLSAQRLLRLSEAGTVDPRAKESATTIVEHVDSIKRLTDEFSKFARMPSASFSPCKLDELVQNLVQSFVETYPKVVFQVITDKNIPVVDLDKEQIRRCIINLLENAVAAVHANQTKSDNDRITIRTSYRAGSDHITLEVVDNGVGISGPERERIFDPYFTTKKGGSGLGLAIVNSVVADHQGNIRIQSSPERGTRVVIELPLRPEELTKRKFANA